MSYSYRNSAKLYYLARNRFYIFIALASLIAIVIYLQNPENKQTKIIPDKFSNSPFKTHQLKHFSRDLDEIIFGEIFPNCGLKSVCGDGSIPVHVYTGKNNKDVSKICIGGKYVLGCSTSYFGRGINAVVLDDKTFTILHARNFDTYSIEKNESESLQRFINGCVKSNDILIFFTFDEASIMLNDNAKHLLSSLGSSEIQNVQFRSHWFMISQKDIFGFSPFEEINFAKGKLWSDPINKTLCVPRKIPGQITHPDPPSWRNSARIKYCNSFIMKELISFCSANNFDEPLYPLSLTDDAISYSIVYDTPILVLPSSNLSLLATTLESILHQPGIHPKNVLVGYTDNEEPISQLASLFGYFSAHLTGNEYYEYLQDGIEAAIGLYGNFTYIIVIDEGIILSPDFLFYLAQAEVILKNDVSLLGISSWNFNGFYDTSGEAEVLYRTEDFPGIGYMIPINLYKTELSKIFSHCCKSSCNEIP